VAPKSLTVLLDIIEVDGEIVAIADAKTDLITGRGEFKINFDKIDFLLSLPQTNLRSTGFRGFNCGFT